MIKIKLIDYGLAKKALKKYPDYKERDQSKTSQMNLNFMSVDMIKGKCMPPFSNDIL